MKFSTPRQVVTMTLLFALLLFGVDRALVPRVPQLPSAPSTGKPQIRMWVNHLCCSGCSSDVAEAVRKAIGPGARFHTAELGSVEEADAKPEQRSNFGNWFLIDVDDLSAVDFQRLDAEVRAEGLVPGQVVVYFGKPSHVRLEASVNHMCCEQCVVGAQSELLRARTLGIPTGRLKWLDSVAADKPQRRITAYASYLDVDQGLDVREFLDALDAAGFQPESVFVRIERERR